MWFLEHVERLDSVEAADAVLDRPHPDLVDGVWVDDLAEEVNLLEAKWIAETGQLPPQELDRVGQRAEELDSPSWLESLESLGPQLESQGILDRQSLRQLVDSGYALRLLYVTNGIVPAEARQRIRGRANGNKIEFWDLNDLELYVRYADRQLYIEEEITLRFADHGVFEVALPGSVPVTYGALSADQIASLPGIQDRTLFAQNVRLDLGRTRVNRDLAATVGDTQEHARFMTFHNGLTILCRQIRPSPEQPEVVTIRGFSVVNGCQSALAFFNNRAHLSPDLLVPVRLVQVGDSPRLADDITYRSNNQNSISLKDLRANDSTQIQIQAEFRDLFQGEFGYQIKRGEDVPAPIVIPNDLAAQILLSLYVGEPWQAHRKSALFAERYKQIFRPGIGAPEILLGYVIWQEVQKRKDRLEDPLLAGYALTTFILIYLVGRLMRETETGRAVLSDPFLYLTERMTELRVAIGSLTNDLLVDVDAYAREEAQNGYFDYKSRFKSQTAIRHLTEDVLRNYKKTLNRKPDVAFALAAGE